MDRFIYRKERPDNDKKNGSSVNSLFNNVFTRLTLLVISIFLLYNVGHSINITIQKIDILRRAEIEVDTLRLKNLELALLLENMQSVEYLEIQARDRLNFAGEKEYIFVIPENVLEESGKDVDRLLYEKDEGKSKPVYEAWSGFLLNGI